MIDGLAVADYSAELAGHEVIWRPGTAHHQFASFDLVGRKAETVLIFLHALSLNEVGDVDHHGLAIAAAADFFFQRMEHAVHLH